jgi:hypothetical protein
MKTLKFIVAGAVLAASVVMYTPTAEAFDSYTECEAYNSTTDICFRYEFDFLTGDYFLAEIYFASRGGETPPPDGIE